MVDPISIGTLGTLALGALAGAGGAAATGALTSSGGAGTAAATSPTPKVEAPPPAAEPQGLRPTSAPGGKSKPTAPPRSLLGGASLLPAAGSGGVSGTPSGGKTLIGA